MKSFVGSLLLSTCLLVGCTSSERELADSSQPRPRTEALETPASEQQVSVPPPPPPLDEAGLEARRLAVKAEIAQLGPKHPWAGVYSSFHVDAGTTLVVAPETGFVKSFSLMGRRSIQSCGRVRFNDGMLVLEPEFPISGGSSQPFELIHVAWGDRHYLLEESDMHRFCNTVNSGQEQANPHSMLLTRSYGAEVRGRPELPAKYRALVLDQPLQAKVSAISETSKASPLIELDVGTRDGVLTGMTFFKVAPERYEWTVVGVHESSCEARCSRMYTADLPIGTQFSTRQPRY